VVQADQKNIEPFVFIKVLLEAVEKSLLRHSLSLTSKNQQSSSRLS
jgi:hypothetical protein